MGLRSELPPKFESKRTYLPPACYSLSKMEKKVFCQTLSQLKVPYGYCSNLRNLHVRNAICRLSSFFNALCSKVVDVPTLDELQNEVVVTLCLFEKYVPPSFFEIMVHLTMHLVREPKGCIAECYIVEEGIEFCTEYLSNVEAIEIPSTSKIDQKVRASIFGGHTMKVEVAIGNEEPVSKTLKWIAHGPSHYVFKYHGYVINGCHYHTKERDDLRATQNSGVSIVATIMQIVDNKNGIRVDDLGFTLVDFNKMAYKSDPFILASQAKQVFYVQDELDPRWYGSKAMTTYKKEASFTLDSKSRRNCMLMMGKCFRSFKNMLTVKYVIPFKDQPEVLKKPLIEYIFIEDEDWTIFVKERLSKRFQDFREVQKERRKKHIYNHHLSRKRYAGLEDEMKKAMEKKDGTYDEVVIPVVEKIMMPSTPQSDVSSSNIKQKQIVMPQVVEQPKRQVDDHVPTVQKANRVRKCQLALGTKENVVVAGTIILECGVNFLVVVDTSYEPNAPLFVPIPNQITTIRKALGYQVSWPAQMLILLLIPFRYKPCKSFLMNDDMDMIISSTEVSSNCLMFYIW
ncbi:hypothetical protein AAG906_014886 [Vitis piasezkii]